MITTKSKTKKAPSQPGLWKPNLDGGNTADRGSKQKEVEETSAAIKVYIEQSELDEIERINACQNIDEGKPVEFYDYEGEPVVITGTSSSGREGVISAEGWRIVPEQDAKGVTKPEQDEFETMSYIGTRVNVGGKSRPNWWVVVGPVYEFERKPKESDEGFRPGFPPGFDPKRAERGLAQEDKADDETHFPTEFSQEEINRMAEMCAAQAISEAKRAIKIYRVEGQPFVITGAIWGGKGKGCLEVNAWPILPLGNVDEKTVKTYSEAVKSGVRGPEFYQNVKINCGSIKHPNWWVMVGPKMTFRVKDGSKRPQHSIYPWIGTGGPPSEEFLSDPRESANVVERACRVCGCTEMDCRQCIEKTGEPCYWVEADLCSACAPADAVAERLHREAVARWRRERPASADAGDSNGYHPQMLQMIPVDQIAPSPTNPRKYFDEGKLRELADSIIEHGLVEPILVRPLRRTTTGALIGGDIGETLKAWPGLASNLYYELIAGERRWRATKLAGLTKIEAKVRDFDDRTALEIQLVENLQRADISPIEEADGYSAMLDLKDEKDASVYTVDSLAARIGKKGKSKGYVYGRLKLRNLPPPALEALAKGDLPATVGELIGRLPSMEMRQEFWDEKFEGYGSDWFEMPSFRDIKLEIERSYMRELKKAPFSRNIAQLVPGVPACIHCPKMTGNNRAEYPDARADMCTDTSCYDQKVKAQAEREMKKTVKKLEKASAEGIRVLAPEESEKWFTYGSLANTAETRGYLDLSEECDEASDPDNWDKPTPTYAELLGDSVKVEVVGLDNGGEIHQLVSRKDAEPLLKQKGIKLWQPRTDTDRKETLKKQQEEKNLRQATAVEIVTRALNDLDEELFNSAKFLRLVAKLLVDHGHSDVARPIAKRRGAEINAADVRGSVEKIVDGLDDADVPGFVVEWLLQGEMESWAVWGSNIGEKFPLCDYFVLKPKTVMREVSAKLKQETKAKAKPKAKANVVAMA